MDLLRDRFGHFVRLSAERLAHILQHPEMTGLDAQIPVALARPDEVIESLSDRFVWLYYRRLERTVVGPKLLCVVVKHDAEDAFVLTAYLTDRVKRGRSLWPLGA